MKKLVISLLVVVMALGTMGFAFANSLPFTGPPDAVVTQGYAPLDDITLTGVKVVPHIGCMWPGYGWQPNVYGLPDYASRGGTPGGNPPFWDMTLAGENAEMGVYGVEVRFNKGLKAGTGIFVAIDDAYLNIVNGNRWAEGHIYLSGDVSAGTWIPVPLEGVAWGDDILDAEYIKVQVVGASK